jgi:hypothetical protein
MIGDANTPDLASQHGVKRWLQSYPWTEVLRLVADHCRLPPEHFEGASSHETRELWERETLRAQSLDEALRLCRRCQLARPFGTFDSESFVLIARDLVKPFLGAMSATLATAVINIVGDYVRGLADELEMNQTINLIITRFPDPVPAI